MLNIIDYGIEEEVRQKAERYVELRDLGIPKEGLSQLEGFVNSWINTVCKDEGLNPEVYIQQFRKRIK